MTHSASYKRVPETYLTIDRTTAAETFVFEINPAFKDPIGLRFEFWEGTNPRAVKTNYSYRSDPKRMELSAEQAKEIRAALLAFDWNQVENSEEPDVIRIVPDDIGVLFRARIGGVYHEARVGLSNSQSIEKLLRDIKVIQ
jgi:hypothetical protein